MANGCLCMCIGFVLLVYQTVCQESIDCDFETPNDFCAWNTSGVPWRRSNRGTDTPGTGPDSGRSGYYIYLEADDFKNDNQIVEPGKCVLLSPVFNTTSVGGCFQFWYHMDGLGIGNLSVAVVEGSPSSPTMNWNRKGPQGNEWKCGQFSLDENKNNIKIELTAWSGFNIQGDIAIDHLHLSGARCPGDCVIVTTTPTPSTSSLIGSTTVPASSSSQYTTLSTVDTATSTSGISDLTKTIIYISVIPVGVLLIGAAVACVCYRSRKKKPDLYNPNTEENHTNEGFHENGEEVYHDLDDATMLENLDGDYTVPSNILPSTQEGDTIQYDYSTSGAANVFAEGKAEDPDTSDYTKLDRQHVEEDATSVESNYLVPVSGPDEGSCERTQEHENRDSLDAICSSELQTDEDSVPCSPNRLSQHVPTPPRCRPTYITAVHEP